MKYIHHDKIRCHYEWDDIKKQHRIVCFSGNHQFNVIATENTSKPRQFRLLTNKNINGLKQILLNKGTLRFVHGVYSEEKREAIVDHNLDVHVDIVEQNGLIQTLSLKPEERECVYKRFKVERYHYVDVNRQIENYYKYFSDTLINSAFGNYVKLIFQLLLTTESSDKRWR